MSDDALLNLLDTGEIRAAVEAVGDDPPGLSASERWTRAVVRTWPRVGTRPDLAVIELRALLPELERDGDTRRLGHALLALGVASVLAGSPEPGTAMLERAGGLLTAVWPRAQALRYLGLALEKQGATEGAAARYLAASQLYAEIGHRYGEGNALYGAAAALLQRGHEVEARELLERAAERLRTDGASAALGAVLGMLATAVAKVDGARAEALLAEAAERCAGQGPLYETDVWARRAEVALVLDRPADALAAAEAGRTGGPVDGTDRAALDNLYAEACLALGRDVPAAQLLDRERVEELSGSVRLERFALRLALAVRHGDEAGWEQELAGLERLVRPGDRRPAVVRVLRRAIPTLAALHGESALRAVQVAVAFGAAPEDFAELVAEQREAGTRLPLGAVWLEARRGEGGMGEVWRGAHRDGTPVAVKLLRDDGDAEQADLFESEMQAVARLDHPHVIRVLAATRLDPTVAALLGRPVGTPAMVMEYASAGSLDARIGGWTWSRARTLLRQLLDALAHAHAREVLHLDIKPANVLLDEVGGVLLPRLGDFGLAGLARRTRRGQRYGTPAYMPPEQARPGAELDPRADLYAFGSLAWHLLTGATLFRGSAEAQLQQHARAPLPAFVPALAVPDGVEEWLRGLLARRPVDRYGCAADAAWALDCLGSVDETQSPSPLPRASATWVVASSETLPLGPDRHLRPARVSSATPRALPAAPFPADWRGATPPSPPPFLVGAGAGLLQWRVGRPVGREAERDRLWSELDEVRRSRQGRCVWVRADRGAGRSALLRWLGETALATGAAWVHHVRVGPDGMAVLPPEDAVAAVRRLPADRPVVALLDDADGMDATGLVRALGSCPALLVVASARPPPPEPAIVPLALDRLPPGELGQALDGLLPLDRALTARLVARSDGSPGFAVAVLTDLVRRDALEAGPEGFRLRPGTPVRLPDDLLGVWTARLDAAAPTGDPRRAGWEVAAVLGVVHPAERCAAAYARLGLSAVEATLAPLLAEGWVERGDGTVRFRVAAVREALLAGAEAGGRLARWHALAADLTPAGAGEDGALGRHLVGAGRHAEALGPLRRAAADAVNATRVDECEELLGLWERSAHALGMSPEDPRRASPLVVRVHLALHRNEDPYPTLARGLALVADPPGGPEPPGGDDGRAETACQLTYTLGWALARDGRHTEALAAYGRALELARQRGLVVLHAVATMGSAASVYATGGDAGALVVEARREMEGCLPDQVFRVDAVNGRGLLRLGRHAAARRVLLAALQAAREARAADVEAEVLGDLAELEVLRGNLANATAWMDRAVSVLGPTGSDKGLGAGVRLAALLTCAGRDEEARVVLGPIRRRYGGRLRPEVEAELGWLEIALDPERPGRGDEAAAAAHPWVGRIAAEAARRRAPGGGPPRAPRPDPEGS